MSDQEEIRKKIACESTVVVKPQPSADSRRKTHWTSDLANEPADRHKHSTAPAVPCTALEDNFKDISTIEVHQDEKQERKKLEHLSSKINKQQASILSTTSYGEDTTKTVENILLPTMDVESGLKVIPSQPIPVEVKPVAFKKPEGVSKKSSLDSDLESVADEVAELPILEVTKISDWSDDQEAGGLPRRESRTSRMSRAVRQLFCCGVAYSPASEDNLSTTRTGTGI